MSLVVYVYCFQIIFKFPLWRQLRKLWGRQGQRQLQGQNGVPYRLYKNGPEVSVEANEGGMEERKISQKHGEEQGEY